MHHFFYVFDYVYVMKFIAGICFEFVEILNMFKLVEIADHFEVIIWLIVFFLCTILILIMEIVLLHTILSRVCAGFVFVVSFHVVLIPLDFIELKIFCGNWFRF